MSKGKIIAAVDGGCRSLKAVCDATKAGTGCGSCIPQVQAVLELAADGLVAEDPSEHYYVPAIPMTKAELTAAIRLQGLRRRVGGAGDAGGRQGGRPASKMGLASLLKTIWADEYEDERDARFINDRVHANIQRDGTFSVVPRIFGGVTFAGRAAAAGGCGGEVRGEDGVKITGGAADRPAGDTEDAPCLMCGGS